ncbi:MAG: hypothetical protein FJX72_21250, partial [Armatimonadetes bacterium]|nr:hypothetical protein [Armatimonadota bacterium]
MDVGVAVAITAVALLALRVGPPLAADGAQAAPRVLLAPGSFEAGLDGWSRQGAAEFACDTAVLHEGRATARIRIARGVVPEYQQLRREFGDDILPGDELRGAVWVRSEGVDQDPGAYLALEFVAADGSRAGIAHSRGAASNGALGWERLEAN